MSISSSFTTVQPRSRHLLYAIGVLFLFYTVGIWGLGFSPYTALFQQLVPFNLLLTNSLLFAFHRDWRGSFLLFMGLAWLIGYGSEWLGVHTGLLFGHYTYGPTLGLKLWDIPLLIGVNWLMLVYSAGHLSCRIFSHWLPQAITGALLMVLLDVLIEPVAITLDFWTWKDNEIPFSNFIGWFGVALLLQIYFHRTTFRKHNPLAPWVYLVQLFFFAALWLQVR